MENIVYLCKNLGVSNVRFNPIFYTGNAACFIEELYLSPKELREIIKRLKVLKEEFGDFITGAAVQLVDLVEEAEKNPPPETNEIEVPPCAAGVTRCNIKPNGAITPCKVLWDIEAGNLKEKDFIDIWKNSPVMRKFRTYFILTKDDIGDCINFIYRRICFTGHRCNPYYYLYGVRNKEFYCLRPDGTTEPILGG
ncbi:MAG: SPASM domain-containing protein [candidate division WOR-3 bacterium]